MRERPARLVHTDGAGRGRRSEQQHQRQLSADHTIKKLLARLGIAPDRRQPPPVQLPQPHSHQCREQRPDEEHSGCIELPAPRQRDALVDKDGTETQSHGGSFEAHSGSAAEVYQSAPLRAHFELDSSDTPALALKSKVNSERLIEYVVERSSMIVARLRVESLSRMESHKSV